MAQGRLQESRPLLDAVLKLADGRDAVAALQLAVCLGGTDDPRKIAALAVVLKKHTNDLYVTTAVMTSLKDHELHSLLGRLFDETSDLPIPLWGRLLELVGAGSSQEAVSAAIPLCGLFFVGTEPAKTKSEQFQPLGSLLTGLRRNPRKSEVLTQQSAAELQGLVEGCMRVADNQEAEMATRVDCLRIVGQAPHLRKSVLKALQDYLAPAQDPRLQLAAIDALAERTQPEVAEMLLEGWRALTPALRARVLDVLLTRREWVAALLAAIKGQAIIASEIDATRRQTLTEYPDQELRRLAAACFADSSTGERGKVVDRYAKSLPAGDATRGLEVFKKQCAACHEFRGMGHQVGPDIAAVKDKSNDGLLREVLDPNRAVDQRYAEYVAITADGRVKNGILVEETSNAIKLRGQQGEQISLLRSELETLTSSGKSLMPEGLENQITQQDMADLLKFLASP
jgi:putative heme-binding domain-containing protein